MRDMVRTQYATSLHKRESRRETGVSAINVLQSRDWLQVDRCLNRFLLLVCFVGGFIQSINVAAGISNVAFVSNMIAAIRTQGSAQGSQKQSPQ